MTSQESTPHNIEERNRPSIIVPGEWLGINIEYPTSDTPTFEQPMAHLSEITGFPDPDNYIPNPNGSEDNNFYDSI